MKLELNIGHLNVKGITKYENPDGSLNIRIDTYDNNRSFNVNNRQPGDRIKISGGDIETTFVISGGKRKK